MIGAVKIGTGYKPSFDIFNPAFRDWVKLSVPLMLGVSLVTADDWILRHYAASGVGDIARLNYAKRLFAVPIAVLGQPLDRRRCHSLQDYLMRNGSENSRQR